ncbi:MAG: hypothetical protein KTR32_24205 [Granulosicoccus sp.]|nr:hypothetical protein [Granulosicoccus sp.]
MDKKIATRRELVERNPLLAKSWLTRILAGPVVMGALMEPRDWSRLRFLLYASPILVAVFAINLINKVNMSAVKQFGHIVIIVYATLAAVLIMAAAYGYKHKEQIDTTGGIKGDFHHLGRYMIWYGLIGASISTGIGLFGWLK